ncbi:DUF7002 family protein [Paenibacillus macerans]|uniref:DUF7002 family protein n=1 Tax=Paenibacillus macerans TaxID=44252 RepID=UPI003D323958
MYEDIIAAITKAKGRKSLYHFTRTGNLPAMAHDDALLSSYRIHPQAAGIRRVNPVTTRWGGLDRTVNANLRIPASMIDESSTLDEFRNYLDRHVFFWPTLNDCRKMLETYTRREPEESFAVLEFDAASLLAEHAADVKLSKYDSGSSPRFPARCSYKKSPDMFVPMSLFGMPTKSSVPTRASDIREVLVEGQVKHLARHLKSVYVSPVEAVPPAWAGIARPLGNFPGSPE